MQVVDMDNPDDVAKHDLYGKQFRTRHQVNPKLKFENKVDKDHNPTGGTVTSTGLKIEWQNGPRGQEGTDELAEPNGAFVEDVIYAAMQRLAFFQSSKYACQENAVAVGHLRLALDTLESRTTKRKDAGTLGKHEV
jgi:hypothetical protein